MSRLYLVIVLLTVFLLILSLSRLRLRLRYRRKGRNDEFAVELFLWGGLLVYKFEIPFIKRKKPFLRARVPGAGHLVRRVLRPAFKIRAQLEGKGGRPVIEEKRIIRLPGPSRMIGILIKQIALFRRYKPALYYLLGRTHLRRLDWHTEVGTGEPAQTGVLTGALWGIKGFLLSYFYALLAPGGVKPHLTIKPSFKRACFNVKFDCIIEFRLGYLFCTGLKAIVLKIRN
ncbi:MAG TPA: DUF2953 domain-containing protein [Bacillota bacterium]|nr:DUF2953 domain-containing protein [Peptococcaceae bacterium MAG4]NLW38475.1 DUF2953 domain-containing protein [Peptococcaceae bacterium]HPU35192.1 DUF2953 domain-containing protein [Bacillota bacterium]HPZ42474.1 DUF2953 domain-containing protein [Bacillota bacterium]HQD75266.1 DUF2953 domain-containing protein [Bacillota bacterium]